jgi:hypothetical protein
MGELPPIANPEPQLSLAVQLTHGRRVTGNLDTFHAKIAGAIQRLEQPPPGNPKFHVKSTYPREKSHAQLFA